MFDTIHRQLNRGIRNAIDHNDKFYEILGFCGPFDGGCLVTAVALQRILGGGMYALRKESSGPDQHIVIQVPELGSCCHHYVDASGVHDEDGLKNFWRTVERQNLPFLLPTTWLRACQSCPWDRWEDADATVDLLIRHFIPHLEEYFKFVAPPLCQLPYDTELTRLH